MASRLLIGKAIDQASTSLSAKALPDHSQQQSNHCERQSLIEPNIPTHTRKFVCRVLKRPLLRPNSFGENLWCDRDPIYSPIRWLKKPSTNVDEPFLAMVEIPTIVAGIDLELGCKSFDELGGVIPLNPKAIEYVSIIR